MHLKEKKYDFLELKHITYAHDSAIKTGQVHYWSLKNQDLHDLFLETLFWIYLCLAKN